MNDRHDLDLEERIGLLSGADFWSTRGVVRDGEVVVRPLVLTDGPHGVRKQPADGDHLGIGDSIPATAFPPAVTLSQTWDAGLAEEVGRALGAEARHLGVDVLLGPGVNIKRSPLGGRNFEYFSEDPTLAGELAGAMIAGIQQRGVAASLKHFAVNNQETDRMRVSAEVDDRALREIYLEAFRIAVERGRPWTVMSAYNRINGVFAAEHHELLQQILRDEWGFDGLVVSDWGGVADRVESLRAGLDLHMPGPAEPGRDDLRLALANGSLDAAVLDRTVERVLQLTERTASIEQSGPPDLDAHHALARRVAERGAVLLTNDEALLPLAADASGLLVVGELARSPRYQGSGSSMVVPTRLQAPIDAIRRLAQQPVQFRPGYSFGDAENGRTLIADALIAASAASTVVLFLGLPPSAESEGYDREHLDLPAAQLDLLAALRAVNQRVVVVLQHGAVVELESVRRHTAAILDVGLAGQAGAEATAALLFGEANPSGKLTETVPRRLEDTPSYGNFPGEHGSVRYGEGTLVGYRGYDAMRRDVAFAFGHGLSYTTFEYADVSATEDEDGFAVTGTVLNTGPRVGAEVVQVYVGIDRADVSTPPRELRGFARVDVAPGERAGFTVRLGRRAFSHWDPTAGAWSPAREAVIEVGASSRDIRARIDVSTPWRPAEAAALTEWSTLAEALAHPEAGPRIREAASSGAMHAMSSDLERMAGGMPLRLIADFEGMLFDRGQLAELLGR